MYYFKKHTCDFNCEKNVAISSATQEAVVYLELCKKDYKKNGVLCGRVINQFGQSVKNAILKIVSETYEPILITKSDCIGNYAFYNVLTNQSCKVIAAAENHSINDEIKVCIKEQEISRLDISLFLRERVDEGLVTGTVLNKLNSLPINSVQIVLYEETSGLERFKNITETNEFGQFVFTRLALGAYLVKICMHGYMSEQYRVHITKCGQIANRVITLCPAGLEWKGTVSGVITDPYQVPIPDADVILYRVENSGAMTPIAYTKTNQNGVYLFINIDIGTYKVNAI